MRRFFVCLAVVATVSITACASGAGGPGGPAGLSADAGKQEEMFKTAKLGPADGEAARSEALYLALLRKTPMDYETWFRLGNLYANRNRPDEAAAAYERVLLGDNGHTRAWHNLSIIRLRQAYASLMQAHLSGNGDDELSKRIDELVEQLGQVSALSDQAKQARPAAAERKKP